MRKGGEILHSLQHCERQMRLAISEAAVAEEPQRLNQLVGWLADIQRIIKEADGGSAAVPSSRHNVDAQPPPPRAQQSSDYPKFFKEGAGLVKVGWSKKLREEYAHKAPQRAVFSTVSAIAKAAAGKGRIVMEQIVPIRDEAGNSNVPDYQAYVTLAWLRKLNLVVQHGRQGYTLSNPSDFQRAVSKFWDTLPTV